MRIMEDVREGCMVQPSSPGHAELRPDNESVEESCQKSDENQNDTPEESDHTEEIPLKQDSDVKSPSISQDDKTESDPNNSSKRKQDEEESPAKKLRADIEENFRQRDKILNEFMEIIDCDNASTDQLQMHSEQLLSEIRTLNDLAREKEMEWNNIIHLKKIKEELLIRIERKRQISIMNGDKPDSDGEENRLKSAGQSLLRYNLSRSPKSDQMIRSRHILQKNLDINGSFDPRQGVRNRPTLDVQSIIADYRQRHPEAVPRRGRRIRNSHNGTNGNSSILNFSSMALGSGSQMKHNFQDMGNELNLLLSAMEMSRGDSSRPSSAESSQNLQDTASFKDILVQFAKLSQNERADLLQNAIKPPPPYPEVTVHPVTTSTTAPTNSLLHGILTKSPSRANSNTAFSPTLARLLTAPERAGNNHLTSSPPITSSLSHPSNMSISEILSTSKARNEITITPVDTQFDQPTKGQKGISNAEDDETEDSADRLVIDEGNEEARRGVDNNSDGGDEVPQCQGCNQKTAQFVCAGCGNQWYCSRDCQVAAWDEHSEVCSG
ncbi:hypothetical protein HHI36_018114 [Cryptolaemus montrouzieri]|uniref:MYND-type domain-containing protein n=1 Tax=Cryptolaemus montrouzieri TaxID=559131 RepID=A0ABD2P004_9CUCU